MGESAASRHRCQGIVLNQDVEICLASVSAPLAAAGSNCAQWMGEAELARLAAMGSETRRRQFIAGHWLARDVAAGFTGTNPHDWLLVAAANGAPELHLRSTSRRQGIHLSLSHSGEMVAAAIAPFPLGIDLESTDRVRDWLALADHVFAPEECKQLLLLPESERQELFYRYWTLKEACGKRDGTGLHLSQAMAQRAHECDERDAIAITWQSAGQCLALVGVRGMRTNALGIPVTARQRFWRFDG
jgi:4'-phosphopantetheinyl transferase